jgi:hypothetical protein
VIDGEAIVVNQDGLSVFDLLRYRRHDHAATLCAFDLIVVDGNDREKPRPKRTGAKLGYLLLTLATTGAPMYSGRTLSGCQ